MSNVKSRFKSRWKVALLATIAGATVSPLAARATMTIDLSLVPLGSTTPYSLKYLTADTTSVPIYVYATITGSGTPATATSGASAPPSSGDFDGLQYAYYNILNSATNPVQGNISTGQLNSSLGFDSSMNDVSGLNTSGGAQTGTIQNIVNGVSVGSVNGSLINYAKARAGQPVWSNATTFNSSTGYTSLADGTNIVPGAPAGTGSAEFRQLPLGDPYIYPRMGSWHYNVQRIYSFVDPEHCFHCRNSYF